MHSFVICCAGNQQNLPKKSCTYLHINSDDAIDIYLGKHYHFRITRESLHQQYEVGPPLFKSACESEIKEFLTIPPWHFPISAEQVNLPSFALLIITHKASKQVDKKSSILLHKSAKVKGAKLMTLATAQVSYDQLLQQLPVVTCYPNSY